MTGLKLFFGTIKRVLGKSYTTKRIPRGTLTHTYYASEFKRGELSEMYDGSLFVPDELMAKPSRIVMKKKFWR